MAPMIDKNAPNGGSLRFAMCALGICVCYMYYGMVQESLFSRQKIGPSFVLLIQCVTNSLVARLWQSLDQWLSSKNKHEKNTNKKSENAATQQQPYYQVGLHHPLLALTALCYVAAMVCSNEALHFVSYPTAVLGKSCKLIPTMAMGVLVERKKYQTMEWLAAGCITTGIVVFNFSRMKHQDGDDGGDSSVKGLALLATSLFMDGLLGSCQGLLKQKRTMPSLLGNKPGLERTVRPPTATETMLFVNLYAILYLIPLTKVNGQMAEGLAMLQGHVSSSMDEATPHDFKTLWMGLIVLNVTVAVGQIFIFLTITWYSSLVCTTITTTRKFFTILLSVIYFGHHFTIPQWIATGLVFSGLYLGIVGQRQSKQQPASAEALTVADKKKIG